ncbi:MAG: SIMPL domain-containing protein [Dehalococcoidia bacterium]|nr:SIMPL domain-containing protein [Dehalococcoidia bacterium]
MKLRHTKLFIPAVALAGVLLIGGCTPTAAPAAPAGAAAPPAATGAPSDASRVAAQAGAYISVPSQQQVGISVGGEGRVAVAPDVAVLRLGVEADAPTVADASAKAAAAMDGIMSALKRSGVAEKDIRTQNFNITQLTRYDDKQQRQIVLGYRVSNQVSAQLRDLSKVGAAIDDAAKAGGDLTRVQGISFQVSNPTAAVTQARDQALKDALGKAQQIAKALNVKVGKPISISESGGAVPVIEKSFDARSAAPAFAAAATPISPGESEVRTSVYIVFAIE